MFAISLQKEIDRKADKVYRGMLELSDRLDETGGKVTSITKFYLEQAENACYDYMLALKKNGYSITHVIWGGTKTPTMNTLIAINGFLGEISLVTGYTFSRLN